MAERRLKLAITATPDANPSVHLSRRAHDHLRRRPDVLASAVEGVRVNVYGVINFNKPVPESSANIYLQQ